MCARDARFIRPRSASRLVTSLAEGFFLTSMPKVQAETYVATEDRHARAKSQLVALAGRIRHMRERRGLTQEDFAAACGISVSFASLLERGERSPSYETLV